MFCAMDSLNTEQNCQVPHQYIIVGTWQAHRTPPHEKPGGNFNHNSVIGAMQILLL